MSLFVGNVARTLHIADLENMFEQFGKCIVNLRGKYAFVRYDSEKDAEKAKRQLHDREIEGQALNIEWAKNSKRYDPKESFSARLKLTSQHKSRYEYSHSRSNSKHSRDHKRRSESFENEKEYRRKRSSRSKSRSHTRDRRSHKSGSRERRERRSHHRSDSRERRERPSDRRSSNRDDPKREYSSKEDHHRHHSGHRSRESDSKRVARSPLYESRNTSDKMKPKKVEDSDMRREQSRSLSKRSEDSKKGRSRQRKDEGGHSNERHNKKAEPSRSKSLESQSKDHHLDQEK